MSGLLLDTSAYSAYRRGDERVLLALASTDRVLMSSVVLGELYYGFRNGSRYAQNVEDLRRFLDKPLVQTAEVTEATAEVYGSLYLDLRQRGAPIPLNDVWIAAQCLEEGAELATLDTHFSVVGGLRLALV